MNSQQMQDDASIPSIPEMPVNTRMFNTGHRVRMLPPFPENTSRNTRSQVPVLPRIPANQVQVPGTPVNQRRVPGAPVNQRRIPGVPRETKFLPMEGAIPPLPTISSNKRKPANQPPVPVVKLSVVNNTPKSEYVPNIPPVNPYIHFSGEILTIISRERDMQLMGTNTERAEQLYECDRIECDWIESIMNKTLKNCQLLTGAKLYVFGALNGVSFVNIGNLDHRDLLNYIRVSILMNNPNHPDRGVLPSLINNLNRYLVEKFVVRYFDVPQNNIKFVNINDLRKVLLVGNTNHINREAITRYAKRFSLLATHKYSQLIGELYQIFGWNEQLWITIAQREPHPMENFILNLDKIPPQEIIDTFGMKIPLSQGNNISRYIRDNIVAYSKILTRGKFDKFPFTVLPHLSHSDVIDYLSKFQDGEIFSDLGVYFPYNNRNRLVINAVDCIRTPRFMYPTIRSLSRSVNKETTAMTDIMDVNTFMICYGTPFKYTLYEVDELHAAFYQDDETKAMEFRRPDNIKTIFTIKDIEGLRELLACFPPTEEINRLINRIDAGLIDAKEKIAYDDIALKQLQNFDANTRSLIREFLYQIFHIGMYMRRWKGPGHDFPLNKHDTKEEMNPEPKVAEELGKGIELLKEMGHSGRIFCLNLKICEYRHGNIECGHARFSMEWDGCIQGDQCIRMSSTRFIGTGYHYLRALFRETIPGMNVKELDLIM